MTKYAAITSRDSFMVAIFLLGGFVCHVELAQVNFVKPPENIMVCRGSDVMVHCGYMWSTFLSVTWIINGTSFTQEEVMNSPLYQLNNPRSYNTISLTVWSINHTTTFQCVVHSTPNTTTSKLGIVTVTTERPVVNITTATGGCGYISVSWIVINNVPNDDMCGIGHFNVKLSSVGVSMTVSTAVISYNFTGLPDDTLFIVTVVGTSINEKNVIYSAFTSVKTLIIKRPNPIMVKVNVIPTNAKVVITVSWQAPAITTGCTANITMYTITVRDQNKPASLTVPANVSSVEISELPDNGTSIVANREYTITISEISDQRTSYSSDPVVVNTFVLQNCTVTSPSTGTIRVSCDSSHQILVTLTCSNNCNNPMVTSNGSSPLTVRGLDPRMMYSVMINVFDGNQVVLRGRVVRKTITVVNTTSMLSSSSLSMPPLTAASLSPTAPSSSAIIEVTTTTVTEAATTFSSPLPSSSTGDSGGSSDSNTGSDSNTNSDSGGSSTGAIAGGVIGGIVAVVVIVIIIIVIVYFFFYKNEGSKDSTSDDKMNLKSPTGTSQTYTSGEEANGAIPTNSQCDKIVYAAPAQIVAVPHQASATGDMYAVSTKAVNRKSQEEPLKEQPSPAQEDVDIGEPKKLEGVTYADLQQLPATDTEQDIAAHPHPAITYAELLM